GLASRAALAANPRTAAVKIDKQNPDPVCIGGGNGVAPLTYPLSRKLYLSSLIGFGAVDGEELQLAGCETDLAQSLPLGDTPAGILTVNASTALSRFDLVGLPASVNGGHPYCEDFNEQLLCGAAGNVDACASAPASLTSFPTFHTTCGNGVVEDLE